MSITIDLLITILFFSQIFVAFCLLLFLHRKQNHQCSLFLVGVWDFSWVKAAESRNWEVYACEQHVSSARQEWSGIIRKQVIFCISWRSMSTEVQKMLLLYIVRFYSMFLYNMQNPGGPSTSAHMCRLFWCDQHRRQCCHCRSCFGILPPAMFQGLVYSCLLSLNHIRSFYIALYFAFFGFLIIIFLKYLSFRSAEHVTTFWSTSSILVFLLTVCIIVSVYQFLCSQRQRCLLRKVSRGVVCPSMRRLWWGNLHYYQFIIVQHYI